MHNPSMRGTPVLALNVEKLRELQRANEIATDVDLARLLGVDTSTLFRVTAGLTAPSNGFMARMKLAFPTVSLDALFSVVEVEKVPA